MVQKFQHIYPREIKSLHQRDTGSPIYFAILYTAVKVQDPSISIFHNFQWKNKKGSIYIIGHMYMYIYMCT